MSIYPNISQPPIAVASGRNGQTGPLAARGALSGTPFRRAGIVQAPEIGSEVRFRRSATHHWERGFVRSRQFCTGIIDVVDDAAKPLRLMPDQYRVVQTPDAFECEMWPDACDCPDGAVRHDCPGLVKRLVKQQQADPPTALARCGGDPVATPRLKSRRQPITSLLAAIRSLFTRP